MKYQWFIILFLTVECNCNFQLQKKVFRPPMKPIKSDRYYGDSLGLGEGYNDNKLMSFTWQSCDTSAPVQASVKLAPDPINLLGNITVSFNASVGVDITPKVLLKMTVKKKLITWITVPCIDNVGSCTYDDVCAFSNTDDTPCPDPLPKYNIPCRCPVAKGEYGLPPITFTLPSMLNVPSGDYQVTAQFSHNGDQLACFDAKFSVA